MVNLSEGRRREVVDAVAAAAGACLLDVHVDADHNRAVLTLAGDDPLESAVRAVTQEGVRRIDVRAHVGAHPRLGAVDVVPFVPLVGAVLADAVAARDRFVAWAASDLAVPCFLYGPERPLPDVRRMAFRDLVPDAGPPLPHATAGAICVGARPVLVAYNVWLRPHVGMAAVRRVAGRLRGPAVRALGLDLGGRPQVSMNLVEPLEFGPADAYDAVAAEADVERAELVGLVPAAVLSRVDRRRWAELDLDPSRTVEARIEAAGRP